MDDEKNKGGRPLKYKTPELLQTAIDDYFDECKSAKSIPGVAGLAYHLGFMDRQSFQDYNKREKFSFTIKRARLRIETELEKRLVGQCTGTIFNLKANYDWKDRYEIGTGEGGVNINIQNKEWPKIEEPDANGESE